MKIQGKIALVTGGAQRIGREIALTLARKGAWVVIHYDRSRAEAKSLRDQIQNQGGQATVAHAHFGSQRKSTSSTVQSFVRQILSEVSHIDILVNNASAFYPTPFRKISEKNWDELMAVNLKAPFFLSQAFGLKMKKRGSGKIINLVDWMGLRPHEKYLPYAISKAGLIAATTGLAKVLAPEVQVLSLAPGPILPSKGMTAKAKKGVIQRTLLKRMGDPRDIAATVRFFCEDTDYITGAFLPVDGGALIS